MTELRRFNVNVVGDYIPWEPRFRAVRMPNKQEINRLLNQYTSYCPPDKIHRVAYAFKAWSGVQLNNGSIPIGVETIQQCLVFGGEMYSERFREFIMGSHGGCTGNCSYCSAEPCWMYDSKGGRYSRLIRFSVAMKLLEVADDIPWYCFSEGLVYSLLSTDVSGVDGGVTLPYPCIALEFPLGLIQIEVDGAKHSLRSAMVTLDNPVTELGKRFPSVLFVLSYHPDDGGIPQEEMTVTYYLDIGDDLTKLECFIDKVAETMVENKLRRSWDKSGWVGGYKVGGAELSRVTSSLLWNSILYLGSRDVDVRRKPKKKVKRRRGGGGVPVCQERDWLQGEEYEVGSTIHVDPLIKRAAIYGEESEGVSTADAHAVCGHFKMQPCGAGRQDRRRIWVSPYVRCRENSEHIVGHTYKLA